MEKGFTLWFTGLSGSGKSTIANAITPKLQSLGKRVEILDGDEVRTNLSKGLGFSKEDRDTNIRRIGYVAQLLSRNGAVVITAAISPYRDIRDEVRSRVGNFVEVYAKCPLEALVARDVKGLYKKALAGEIKEFTGVSDPYEEPLNPEIIVETDRETVEESMNKILARLAELGYLPADGARPIAPHGGQLVNRLVTGSRREALLERARSLPTIQLDERAQSDVEMIAVGAFSPLRGFIGQQDYHSIVESMRLANGLPWSIPVVASRARASGQLTRGSPQVALTDDHGVVLAILTEERYAPNRRGSPPCLWHDGNRPPWRRCDDARRRSIWAEKSKYSTAPTQLRFPRITVTLLRLARYSVNGAGARSSAFKRAIRFTVPTSTSRRVRSKSSMGYSSTPSRKNKSDAFPLMSACVLRSSDGALLPPGPRTPFVYPAAMRYAGPREAIFHAIARKNYGCTHFIVGRDHAGVGNYYGTYDAQNS
jgi:sulfate adenylyltransferase/3'-phosphoadenosine 5'-phosphosulfate synthase